ncbi:hypothetical protein CEXT_311541 [Caerostris extrusa]|uniref:Uncharacterized protein n=1 Tax=Caerostris extrusa TaxID=172846 RepID=A0AAV4NIP1_CAEEX|nr:hypothetical protein CEXT_311541 [Caerostris extrusa]
MVTTAAPLPEEKQGAGPQKTKQHGNNENVNGTEEGHGVKRQSAKFVWAGSSCPLSRRETRCRTSENKTAPKRLNVNGFGLETKKKAMAVDYKNSPSSSSQKAMAVDYKKKIRLHLLPRRPWRLITKKFAIIFFPECQG